MVLKQTRLNIYHLLLTVLSAGLLITASGGGLFGQETFWMDQWQHKLFEGLCHQMPGRSFWIGSAPMAVCARCFGIYAGFGSVLIILPVIKYFFKGIAMKHLLIITSFTLLANMGDAAGSMLGFWDNTLWSRATLGFLMGSAGASLFIPMLSYSLENVNVHHPDLMTYGK
ncbi:MAG: DUF2085 domain-containing protein [Balneolaceae bacterium]|nr:DUF2085 domain-containing protein [Balneolaceae bacterium]